MAISWLCQAASQVQTNLHHTPIPRPQHLSSLSCLSRFVVSCTPSWFWGPVVTLEDCLAAFFAADELKGEWPSYRERDYVEPIGTVPQPACSPGLMDPGPLCFTEPTLLDPTDSLLEVEAKVGFRAVLGCIVSSGPQPEAWAT